MCFYEQYVFACGDFKWGNFKDHCVREYRKGETCGLKLVHEKLRKSEKCKHCRDLDIKHRKIKDLEDKVRRWKKEGNRRASIEKALDDLEHLGEEVRRIETTRQIKAHNAIGSNRPMPSGSLYMR